MGYQVHAIEKAIRPLFIDPVTNAVCMTICPFIMPVHEFIYMYNIHTSIHPLQ